MSADEDISTQALKLGCGLLIAIAAVGGLLALFMLIIIKSVE
jgi:hypothetical protein